MGTRSTADELPEVLHLFRLGDLDEAAARCRAIVARDPRCGEAWDRLARIAELQGRLDEAEADYRRAVDLLAEPAEAHNNLAVLLQRRGDLDGALEHYSRAAALGLRHAMLHSNLGCLLRQRGQLQGSAEQLRRALAIDPALAHAHSNLGVTLALLGGVAEAGPGSVASGTARALPHLRRAVALQPDWNVAHSNLLLCLNYADDLSPVEVAAEHLAFGRRHAIDADADALEYGDAGDADPERALRVGFVSPDLRRHPVASFLEPILDGRDPDALSVTCYADVERPDEVTGRLRAAADRWRAIHGQPDADVARQVRADRIDILIDLAGHTAGNRMSLFAARVAPVQMTYLGYPNTTGLHTVDWRITDAWADPPGQTEALHSEELLRVAGGFLCFRPHPGSPEPGPLPALARGRVTFGSFNQAAKISPATMTLWAEILRQVPGARLCIKGPGFSDPATRAAFERSLALSPLAGLPVELWGHLPDERVHLGAYGQIDIALDTWPYAGTTTTCEALWMGVPVVTLAGRSHASRVGASLLSRLGERSLIADSRAGYVAAAVGLATDLDRLATLRASLRGLMIASGITDGRAFAGAFAEALRRAWRFHCHRIRAAARALPPASATAPLAGELRVVVPDRLDQITPYVLTEQHDWFEDEISFVRAALSRGERAVDIGANHGVYALTMGRRVGFAGQVWAFEPARAVADRLRASVAINALPQIAVIDGALSDREGHGALAGGDQSELGHLVAPGEPGGAEDRAGDGPLETVALFTLDGCRRRLGLVDIAMVKIDAEGAESAIIEGGRSFFAEESPLVMFEIRHAETLDLGLCERFRRLGYQTFRLIPGLGMLAPFTDPDTIDAIDPFLLNLFACKPDRASRLEQRGLLARAPASPEACEPVSGAGLVYLRAQPFAAALWPRWTTAIAAATDEIRALDQYARAQDVTELPAIRHAALAVALAIARGGARAQARVSLPILHTIARIAGELGARAVAADALNQIVGRCATARDDDFDRPFLAVSPRFDQLPPREGDGELGRWALAAALEQRERLRAFSSFFTAGDPATLAALESIATLGYGSREMARRLELVRLRRG
ncbi:MAG TPA: FkbM family methyltransferase [Polyangia bacterium]|jgi:FkbM family methyltransferase|nr:FkbM family methyltransferase [Polyangia bacterium]